MKWTLVAMALLALVGIGATVAYQAAARERDYRALLARGDATLADEKTFDAIEAYSGAIALRPDSMLPYLRRGETYLQRNELEAAARDFGKATALDPSATRPLEDLADVQYRRERYDQAADSYTSLLQLDDRSAPVTYKLALARYRRGDTTAALAALNQALKLDDKLADAHYLRGMCLRQQGQNADAVEAFERAASISPGLVSAREELADLYAALGKNAEALEQLQVLAGLDRDHVARQVAVGLADARAGRWDLAVLTLGGALERAPSEPLIYQALGQVWLERPRDKNDRVNLSKAREALDRVALAPNAPSEMLTLYGRVLVQNGETDAGERILQQATARYPVEPSSFLEYATVAERQNHDAEARQALASYQALASSDTSDPRVAKLLAAAENGTGRTGGSGKAGGTGSKNASDPPSPSSRPPQN
jgi:tetratricopeptide (TPR) repeat protein